VQSDERPVHAETLVPNQVRSALDQKKEAPKLDREPIKEDEESQAQLNQSIQPPPQESIEVHLDVTVAHSQTINDSTMEQDQRPF